MSETRRERVGVIVIHGVGETTPGWVTQTLVPELDRKAAEVGKLAFLDHSEVRALPDLGRSSRPKDKAKANSKDDDKPKFEFRAHRGNLDDGQSVSFLELYWADLSRVGTSWFEKSLALLQLFFEAPLVLAQSLLNRPVGPLHRLMRFLTLLSAWLIRWPIAGINVAVFATCFMLIISEPLRNALSQQHDPYLVAVVLTVIAAFCFWFASWRWRKDIVLTEIGVATAICALIMTVLVLAQVYLPWLATRSPAAADMLKVVHTTLPMLKDQPSIPAYLVQISVVIFLLWAAWTVVVVAACAVLGLMIVVRLPKWRSAEARASPTVARSAAALGLVISQGLIWKIFVSIFSIMLVGALVRQSVDQTTPCLQNFKYFCDLREINSRLFGVFAFNLLFALGLAFLFAALGLWRVLVRQGARGKLFTTRLPRLIVHPWILAALIIGTLINAHTFYIDTYEKSYVFGLIRSYFIDNKALFYITGGSIGLFLFMNLFTALQEAAGGVLHIGRDLVDHQYRPGKTMARLLMQRRQLHTYPRRMRIQGRLDSMVKNFVNAEKFDRIVFVTHSQGSVIMFDYLDSKRDDKDLADIRRIDVVTLGSPLTHLYQYYFSEYERTVQGPATLHPKLESWTNMWRIDDPIGNRVEIVKGDFIQNRPIGPGGHVNYWKEKEVCQVIVDLIRGEEAGPVAPSRPSKRMAEPTAA